jgi:hypothetical protein
MGKIDGLLVVPAAHWGERTKNDGNSITMFDHGDDSKQSAFNWRDRESIYVII